MLNKLINFFKEKKDSPVEQEIHYLKISDGIYKNLDFIKTPDFQKSISNIENSFFKDSNIFISKFKDYFNNDIKILLEKMSITPLIEEQKFHIVYKHIDNILGKQILSKIEKKIINKLFNDFIINEKLPEFIKLYLIEVFIRHIDFTLYNLNKLLTMNNFDLIYFIITNNLYDSSIEINYNSFLLFNKNIKDLNYAALQIKRKKLGEFLKFLFQKYEGKQSKKDIELLIINKVFSSGLLSNKNKNYSSSESFSLDSIHKKDFLIPIHLLEVFESCSTIKEVIIKFFGKYNRRLESLVINAFFKDSHINYDIFAWGLLIKPLNINIDVISNHLENKEYPNKLYQVHNISSLNISFLKKFYNDKRILKMISNIEKEDSIILKDTIDMLDIVYSHNLRVEKTQITKLIKKPKKFIELHDFLSILTLQLKQRNFSLKEFQDSLNFLELKKSSELNLSIKVPKTNYDLIEIGQKLNICVGGGSYSEKIKSKKCLIFTVFKNGVISYCVEIHPDSYKIIQAKAQFNKDLPKLDYLWVQNQLIIPQASSV